MAIPIWQKQYGGTSMADYFSVFSRCRNRNLQIALTNMADQG